MPLWRFVLAMTSAIGVAACAVGPDFASPDVRVPAAFKSVPAPSGSVATSGAASQITSWWHTLRDRELNSLIERAVLANPEIAVALNRLQQAREHEIVVLGAALPNLSAGGSVARGSGTDSVKSPRIPASLDAGINTTGFQEITGVAGFDAGWELDLFGKYRRELEAARYDTQALADARNSAIITVVAEVARNYVILRGLQARIAVVRENIESAQRFVDLTLTRYDQGVTNEGDVLLARREFEALNAVLPSLNAAIFEAESRIALLLGTFSGNVIGELKQVRGIPQPPERLRPGQPIELLRRRPDIRRAENELASATARIGVAAADLFPRVGVTAGLGVQGGREAISSNPPVRGLIWSVGPGAYWPLLDFGRLDATVDEAEYRTREFLAEYRRVVIAAVEEANTALAHYQAAIETVRHLRSAVDVSRRAVEFNTGRYQQGISDFLNVLDAVRQEYTLQEQYVSAQQAVALAYIALYKALGGGWELYSDIPPIMPPDPAIVAEVRRLSNVTTSVQNR